MLIYRITADFVVVCHLLFIIYVVAGGLLSLRWPRSAFVHLPCAAWAVWIEFSGGICPLTPLETRLRHLGAVPGYTGSFIEHYLLPLIYPAELTREIQFIMGGVAALMAVVPYCFLVWRLTRKWEHKKQL